MEILDSDAIYYYGYPGDAINDENEPIPFFNKVPFHTVERKVSSRIGTMGVDYINFHSNTDATTTKIYDLFQFELDRQHTFSPNVEIYRTLKEKDDLVKSELLTLFNQRKIYQAQPYSDTRLQQVYHPASLSSISLNDKLFLEQWVPTSMLLKKSELPFPNFPFIGKLSRSSAGDATKIIKSEEDLQLFTSKFSTYADKIPLFYEEFVSGKEYGIEFFRSSGGKFHIIGLVESSVDEQQSYSGGVLSPNSREKLTAPMKELVMMIEKHLSEIDWSGWGGLDVIEDPEGNIYVIDPNVRTTQIMPAVRDMYRHGIAQKMQYSAFALHLDAPGWFDKLEVAVKSGLLKGYGGTIYKNILYGDGAVMFDQQESLCENRKQLRQLGILFG